jgi:small-conductance mechanosensitive channel
MKKYVRFWISVLLLIFLLVSDVILSALDLSELADHKVTNTLQKTLIIAFAAVVLIDLVNMLKNRLLRRYDITAEDNLHSRKLHTQINILEKVIVFVIVLTAVGLVLLSIDSIKEIGVGLFASAGVVGIIVGLSAQKIVGALLAGIQIAITQPFRLDDAVLVENEWGWIEEINLTFIVVRIWDKRRLVLPTTYFLEKPFQNWTKNSADIVGSVFYLCGLQNSLRPSAERTYQTAGKHRFVGQECECATGD